MKTAATKTVATQTSRGSAGEFMAIPAQQSCARTLHCNFNFLGCTSKRSIHFEAGAAARRQQNPRFLHAAAIFETDQPIGDSVFPDRQMRATSSPRLGVLIAPRRLRYPGQELLRQCVSGILHGA